MNREEAKQILLLYRPETADAEDPQIAEALALAKTDAELARWFAEHCERQRILRDKFRQITAPEGLLEQIISEQAALEKMAGHRRTKVLAAFATAVVCTALALLAWNYWPQSKLTQDVSFANYEKQMAGLATTPYSMNFLTNDLVQIRAYLAQNGAPADYTLPGPLAKTAVAGCTTTVWNGQKVSMVCFRTGQPLPAGQQSDLWLFVVDAKAVTQAPTANKPLFGPAAGLSIATWINGNKLYLLGTRGDEAAVRKFL